MVMTAKGKSKALVRFADLPRTGSALPNSTGFTETFANSDLTLIEGIPLVAAIYLLITIVERRGRRHTYQCLTHGNGQQEALANSVAQYWCEGDGEWDENESILRFDTHYFVLAEDWRELSMAEYINLYSVLTDCTPAPAEYSHRQTRGLD